MRTAIYARVSTEEQTVGGNIGAQIEELEGLIPPSDHLVHRYKDEGVSGAIPFAKRPVGARLLADAEAGLFDMVLATRLDRIGRSVVDIRQLAERLAARHVSLKAQGLLFGQDAMGRLLLNVFGTIAEFERDLIRDRTLGGKKFKIEALGRWPGGTVPYGYSYDKGQPGQRGTWALIEDEADVVRRIFHLCAREDVGTDSIAERLNNEAIPAPSAALNDPKHPRAKVKYRSARRWGGSHLSTMLRNPAYMGRLVTSFGDMPIPPIVDETLWQMAQEKLDARRSLPHSHGEAWPLQGRVICGDDGHVFCCRRNTGGRRVYSCRGREARAHLEHRCGAPRLDADWLEEAVEVQLIGVLSNPTTCQKVIEDYLSALAELQEAAKRGLAPILDRLDELEGRAARLDDMYYWGRLTCEDYQERLGEIASARQGLDAARGKRQKEIDEYSERARQIEQIQTALTDGTLFAHWSDGGLKVDLLDESRFRSNGKVRKGREALNEIISARFERPMSLNKLFELLDIKAVVHSDRIEVRGAFTNQDGFGPRLLLGRRSASASAGKRL
jgi:site-specific DNA recombinase